MLTKGSKIIIPLLALAYRLLSGVQKGAVVADKLRNFPYRGFSDTVSIF
jgi:hypothetical protein